MQNILISANPENDKTKRYKHTAVLCTLSVSIRYLFIIFGQKQGNIVQAADIPGEGCKVFFLELFLIYFLSYLVVF